MPDEPLVLWLGIEADFECTCGESQFVEDCMLPATVVCNSCGQFWLITYGVEKTERKERPQ